MRLTKEQLRKIAKQEVDKLMNENISRRELCKNAALAGTAAWIGAGCELEYDIGHLSDQNVENMQLPECVQNCYYNDYDNPRAWPKELDQFTQQFEGEKFIDVAVTEDASTFGQHSFAGMRALIVGFHNVPMESPSLEEVLHVDDAYAETYWNNENVLLTVEVCFLIKDNMIYFNAYQPGGPYDPEIQTPDYGNKMPDFTIQGDAYFQRSDLKQCLDAYKAYLFGPIRPEQQEAP